MTQDETQETRESPALDADADEVRFSTATAPAEPAGDSPAAAQERAEHDAEPGSPAERPELQILGAFVGAFVLAKLLKRLFGRD
jgi:hypothetical protein